MSPMNVIDVFAGVMLVGGDMFALLCLFGSALLFLTGLLSLLRKKRIRFGGQELQWSILGLVFGVSGQFCLLNSPQTLDSKFEGIIMQMPVQTVNLLFLLSFCLLILGFLLRRAVRN